LSAVFVPRAKGELPDEPLKLGVMLRRPEKVYGELKGLLDALAEELNVDLNVEPAADPNFAPGRFGEVRLGRKPVGWIGQVRPEQALALKIDGEIGYFELDIGPVLAQSRPKQFSGVAKFPVITRDLTVVVPVAVTWRQVQAALADLPNVSVKFVGDYYGRELTAGHKSLTLSLTVAHPDRTPRETEAVEVEGKVRSVLTRTLAAQVPKN
jgi:phenylalanyl-tRNA synthetase beta chain